MTVLTRGARPRRSGRRPGWLLLTVLLALAIMASSALVFTNRVELLKLAVILALWAAVVGAFVSVIYRRQSDIDQAKARDLKLVYDLQLDREISARREYELTVESELRRELSTEIRAQAADEVAALRAELAALRANLEYLFDADLSHRPAIETEHGPVRPGRVASSRIDDEGPNQRTEENPIIDVSAEPHPPEHEWSPMELFGGAHRRASEAEPTAEERLAWAAEQRTAEHRAAEERAAAEQRAVAEQRAAEHRAAAEQRATELRAAEKRAAEERRVAEHRATEERRAAEQQAAEQQAAEVRAAEERQVAEHRAAEERALADQRAAAHRAAEEEAARQAAAAEWRPAPADGEWIPAGTPGSNWSPAAAENGTSDEYVGRRRAPEPAMSTPPADPRRGRHSAPADAADPGRPQSLPPPTLAAPPQPAPPPPPPAAPAVNDAPRHRSADEAETTGGHSVAELLARLDAGSSGGGRRRRREE